MPRTSGQKRPRRRRKRTVAEQIASSRTWYKATRNDGTAIWATSGQGFDAVYFQYHLPKGQRPGAWHHIPEAVSLWMCRSGFHVTKMPFFWLDYSGKQNTGRIFEVEIKEDGAISLYDPKKAVVRHMRLVKEIKRGTRAWERLALWL